MNSAFVIYLKPKVRFLISNFINYFLDITLDDLRSFDSSTILSKLNKSDSEDNLVFVVCHRGNDSQLAVRVLQEKLSQSDLRFKDIVGGLDRWAIDVDQNFPRY